MSTDDEFADSAIADEEEETSGTAYGVDEFEDYSNVFESGGGGESSDGVARDRAGLVDSSSAPAAAATPRFESGDRVQVLWADENEWFDGKVTRVDDAARACAYHVQYDDGEAAWETGERMMRYAPEAFGLDAQGFQQLQQLLTLPSMRLVDGGGDAAPSLLHAGVLVFWVDSSSWFAGSIADVDTSARALQVEYEDGDTRWEQERNFASVLVRVPARSTSTRSSEAVAEAPQTQELLAPPQPILSTTRTQQPPSLAPPPPPPTTTTTTTTTPLHQPERVLIPRAYKAAASDHFRPELTPRPYTSVTHTIGSIVIARSAYSERRYLHAKLECTSSASRTSDRGDSRDCLVQTEIPAASNGDSNDSTRCMACPSCRG